MNINNFTFISTNEKQIFAMKWFEKDNTKPQAIIQIAHGMAEHIERYDDFAKTLVSKGFFVYGNDHRGHGKTSGSVDNLGYFADENGWNLVVDDMHKLTTIIKEENPNVPIFILGHSMGSFLSRAYIQLYSNDIKGVILSGTGGNPGLLGHLGIFLAKQEIRKKGKRAKSEKLDNLSFGNFNKSFAPTRTNFDWLSRDTKSVDKYIEDSLCGTIFTSGFFYDFLVGLKDLNKRNNINKISKELPIYLISGDKDPVGNNTKGVLQAYNSYKKASIKDVQYKFYKDARHEILNETNKEEVYNDIIDWINQHC